MSNFRIGNIVRPTFEPVGLNDLVHIGLTEHYNKCRSLFKVEHIAGDYMTVSCLRCGKNNEYYSIRFKLYNILVTLKDTNDIHT